MIDVDALTAADVALAITPAAVRRPVAEAIFTFIFALSTNLLHSRQAGAARPMAGRSARSSDAISKGRTLGSLGCGNIAQEMFRMAGSLGFGRLIACDPFVTREQAAAIGVELVSMDELFEQSDFVTVNTLLNKTNAGHHR